MNADLLLSLPITAVGYLLIPTLCSLLLKKDVGRGNQIVIVVTNAVVIFALFTGLKFLGNGELTGGNAVAAIIWSYIGFIILKNKQSKLLINEEEDVLGEKAPSPSENKSKQMKRKFALPNILIIAYIIAFTIACVVLPMNTYAMENRTSQKISMGLKYNFIWNIGIQSGTYEIETIKEYPEPDMGQLSDQRNLWKENGKLNYPAYGSMEDNEKIEAEKTENRILINLGVAAQVINEVSLYNFSTWDAVYAAREELLKNNPGSTWAEIRENRLAAYGVDEYTMNAAREIIEIRSLPPEIVIETIDCFYEYSPNVFVLFIELLILTVAFYGIYLITKRHFAPIDESKSRSE